MPIRFTGIHLWWLKIIFIFLATIIALYLIMKPLPVVFFRSVSVQEQASNPSNRIYPNDLVSEILVSHAKPQQKSTNDYVSNLRFGHQNWTDGKPLLVGTTPFQPQRKTSADIQEFMSRKNLTLTPFDTDGLSPYLTTSREVISEAQRIHVNLFTDLLRGKKYAVLFQLAVHENKGDAAIGVGELALLQKLGIKILFYVDTSHENKQNYARALTVAQRYPREEVVVLLHGGGNIFGYHGFDIWREKALRLFRQYSAILFPQSIYMRGDRSSFHFSTKLYCCNPRLTIILRDRLSLQIAQRLFNNGTRLLLSPDMAFQLGPLNRHISPYYDISWLKRGDGESPGYSSASVQSLLPANLAVRQWDWLHMASPYDENAVIKVGNILEYGQSILQRGRVVVTDRLHGHILCTLLDIPHVLLDNADKKLSSYHNTWTRGLSNCRLASTVEEAVRFALELLEEFKDVLPQRLTAVDLQAYK